MDPTTAVRTDAVPVIATVLAPGAFASVPYIWAALAKAPDVLAFLDNHESIALASAILLWVVAGFGIESLSSYVEVYWIDYARPDREEMLAVWFKYLRIAWTREPVGQHYLRRMLVSFKFELNMSVALAATIPGLMLLGLRGLVRGNVAFVGSLLLLYMAAAFFRMAAESADVLSKVRSQLVLGVGEPPFDDEGNPAG